MSKKKQTAAGLFFSMLLRAAVIILGIAIVAFGAFFVMQAVKGGSSGDSPATTLDANALTDAQVDDLQMNQTADTSADTTEETAQTDAKDKKILLLNGAGVNGLAGRWADTLKADGYANVDTSNYNETVSDTKVVSTQEGVGEELVGYFSSAGYEVGTVTSGADVSTDGYDIVIIVGTADSSH